MKTISQSEAAENGLVERISRFDTPPFFAFEENVAADFDALVEIAAALGEGRDIRVAPLTGMMKNKILDLAEETADELGIIIAS